MSEGTLVGRPGDVVLYLNVLLIKGEKRERICVVCTRILS